MEIKDFITMYEDQYSSGDLNPTNYLKAAEYVQGYSDAKGGVEQLERCANMLRSAALLTDILKIKG